jgi:hypothetical protein
MPSVMTGRRMCHARQPALGCQVFVCLQPGWYRIPSRTPVGVRRLVTPFDKTRHSSGMRFRAAKRLHRPLAFPRGQSPKRPMSVNEESSAEEPRRTRDLALTQKGHPQKCRNISQPANAKPRDRGEHSLSILSEKNWSRGRQQIAVIVRPRQQGCQGSTYRTPVSDRGILSVIGILQHLKSRSRPFILNLEPLSLFSRALKYNHRSRKIANLWSWKRLD